MHSGLCAKSWCWLRVRTPDHDVGWLVLDPLHCWIALAQRLKALEINSIQSHSINQSSSSFVIIGIDNYSSFLWKASLFRYGIVLWRCQKKRYKIPLIAFWIPNSLDSKFGDGSETCLRTSKPAKIKMRKARTSRSYVTEQGYKALTLLDRSQ